MSKNASAHGQWSEQYIKLAESLSLSVYGSQLNVNASATRGAVVQTILEALGIAMQKYNGEFKDVTAGTAHAKAIATAVKLGIIQGDTDASGKLVGTFRAASAINRAEIAQIFSKLISKSLVK
jgi:hypothetical protein